MITAIQAVIFAEGMRNYTYALMTNTIVRYTALMMKNMKGNGVNSVREAKEVSEKQYKVGITATQ